jgi:Reverse transcriptase (RNA-dependent DNA polymerase)/RNase H-like domain found in reverse transcriptase/Integrase zinc binding domain/Integrase core domain
MCDVPHTYSKSTGTVKEAIVGLGQEVNLMINSLRSPSMRPYAKATIHGEKVLCLFDTGADVSCVNSVVFLNWRSGQKVNDGERSKSGARMVLANEGQGKSKPLKAAGGQVLKVQGNQKIKLEIDGKMVEHPFLVIDDLNESMILGIDFITKHGLNYSPATREFSWENEVSKWSQGFCKSIRSEKIPALSSKLIKVNLITTGGRKPHSQEVISACAAVEGRPLLCGSPGLVRHQEGVATILIKNCAPVDVEIKRDESVGRIENLTGWEIKTITEKVPITQVMSTKLRLSKGDAKFIKENANLNVPEKYLEKYMDALLDYQEIISKHKNDLGRSETLQHEISLKNKEPVYVKQFRIPEAHREQAELQVIEWLKLGVVEPCRSKFNSPLFMVSKKDGGLRIVQDFRALNEQTMEDKYSMHDVSECVAQIGRAGSTIFSTIDLTSGFWQMVLHPDSRPYTAFTLPGKGQHQWTVAPMGLLGSPASFQRLVETALKDIPNVIVYIDDLLIHTHSHEQQIETLRRVFARLQKHNLKINLKKCFFGSTNVAYLGFRLTPEGILPGSDKLKAVGQTPPPANVKEVRQFLGLCNFFRTHVKNFALVSSPLTVLTRKDSPWKKGPLPPESFKAYRELQSILCSEPVVAYPRNDRTYALITDASGGDDKKPGGLGAILTQVDKNGTFYVISYASRKLAKHEQNYTAFLLEMQAAVWAMDHYDVNLRGRHFLLYTDHKPLEKLGKVHTKTLNRLQEAMNHFSFQIIYKKGSEMPADYLSRNAVDAIQLDNDNVANLQSLDPLISAIKNFLFNRQLPEDNKLTKLVKHFAEDCFISDNILWRRIIRGNDQPRVVLFTPKPLTQELIAQAHGQVLTGHDGTFKTKERLLESYYWPAMDKEILEFIKSCHKCQTTKKYHPLGKQPIQPLPQCSQLNQRIHADLFGPLKTSEKGKKYILCITDAFTKYVELVAISNKEASTIADAIFQKWICRYGCPLQITTDNGKEFCAQLSEHLFQQLGSTHLKTSPYHPQCNSQVEIVNKTIAKYLASFVDESTLDWELFLPPLMFCYNTSVHTSTKTSPHFLTYGYFPRLPLLFGEDINKVFYGENSVDEQMAQLQHARQIAAQNNDDIRDKYIHLHDKNLHPQHFSLHQKVLIDENQFLNKNRKLAPKYNGPFVINKLYDTNAEIIGKNGRKSIVHLNRLKPYVQAEDFNAPHILDLYKNVSQPIALRPAEPISQPIALQNTDIRRKRGRPRKIVSDNLFETRRDVNDDFENQHSQENLMREENNANNGDNGDEMITTDKRITRSAIKNFTNENQQNYFQSLNSLKKGNTIYSQKIFTVVTKRKRLRNGAKRPKHPWNEIQRRNYKTFGDMFECVQPSGHGLHDQGVQLSPPQSDGTQTDSSSDEPEEEGFDTATSGSNSEEDELEIAAEEDGGTPPLLPLPRPGLPIIRPELPQNDTGGGSGNRLPSTQVSPGQRFYLRYPSPMSPRIRFQPQDTLSSPTLFNRRTSEIQRPLGARNKGDTGERGAAGGSPGGGGGDFGAGTTSPKDSSSGYNRSRLSAYEARDERPVGVRKTVTPGPSTAKDMADLLGLTGKEISRAERDALVDDTLLTKRSSTPVRSRAQSSGARTGGPKGPVAQKSRRAKTPENSPAEKKAKDTLSGVQHAKARLILDKRAAAEGKPAQIIRSTRTTTTVPDIWPIKDTPKTKKFNSSKEGAFPTSSKIARSPQ